MSHISLTYQPHTSRTLLLQFHFLAVPSCRMIPLQEALELQGGTSPEQSGCEVTAAACIYRLSDWRNVLLTVQGYL